MICIQLVRNMNDKEKEFPFEGMRVAPYVRESDDSPHAPKISGQIERAEDWIKNNKCILFKIYADIKSGGDWNREGFLELMKDARGNRFHIVLVWAKDRIARDTLQFLDFFRKMEESHIKVFDLQTNKIIDMIDVDSKFSNTIEAAMEERFRTETGRKVKKVYEHKKAMAMKRDEKVEWGRTPIPQELRDMVIKIKKENPNLGYNKIAVMLPKYKLKIREEDNGVQRYRKASAIWVRGVLRAIKKYPLKNEFKATDVETKD
jgi:DNA invertase Pin-like site-specific DNA recombinase